MDVAIEKRGHVFRGRRNFVFLQNTDDNSGIGHTGDLDVVQIVFDLKTFGQRPFECFNTGAAGMYQGAVDVEKEKALWN